jgi:hypothetical protein
VTDESSADETSPGSGYPPEQQSGDSAPDPSPGGPATQQEDAGAPDSLEPSGAPFVADPYRAAPSDPYEGAVPPGYDWPTHGGYLGCLLGLVGSCLVGGFLGSFAVGLLSVSPLAFLVSSALGRITLIAVVFIATVFALGRVGWVLGKRFYREYPLPARSAAEPGETRRRRSARTGS